MPIDLPRNLDAERAVLSTLSRGDDALMRVAVSEVEPEDFYESLHQDLFSLMRERWEQGRTWDVLVLTDDLKVHGVAYQQSELAAVVNAPVSPANIREYCTIVYRTSQLRGILDVARQQAEGVTNSQNYQGLLAHAQSMLDDLAEREAMRESGDVQGIVAKVEETIEYYAQHNRPIGFYSGLPFFDRLKGGLRKGHFDIIAGGSNVGKTWCLGQMGNAALNDGANIVWFSEEMSAEQTLIRLIANRSGVDSRVIERGRMDKDELYRYQKSRDELIALPLKIYDSLWDVSIIARKVRYLKPDLVIVDSLNQMEMKDRESEYEAVTRNAFRLFQMKKRCHCCVLASSEVSNDTADRKGKGTVQVRGSGRVKYFADSLVFYERNLDELPDTAYFKMDKNRHGPRWHIPYAGYAGPAGMFPYHFDETTGRFEEIRPKGGF